MQPDESSIPKGDNTSRLEPTRPLAHDEASAPTIGLELGSEIGIGMTLGGFEVRAKLGQGGMGAVYKAWDGTLERPVALKVISRNYATSGDAADRLRTEAQAAARLNHPNIVAVYAAGQHNGIPYIAMEFVDGTDLGTLLRRGGPMAPARALAVLRQAAEGLKFAAANHIIHRDMKPANLLLLRDGTVKVSDFGLAKRLDADSQLTATHMILGSPSYMAPEQGMGEIVDFRADIYSLGCTLHSLLTARVPYEGTTPVATIMMHTREPVPKLDASLGIGVNDMQALLERMMAKEPKDRFASYAELIGEIDRVSAVVEGSVPSMRTVSAVTKMTDTQIKRSRTPFVLAIAAGGIGLCALAAALWSLVGGDSKPDQRVIPAPISATVTPAPTPVPTPQPTPVPAMDSGAASQQGFTGAPATIRQVIAQVVYTGQEINALAEAIELLDEPTATTEIERLLAAAPTDAHRLAATNLRECIRRFFEFDTWLRGAFERAGTVQLTLGGATATLAPRPGGRVQMTTSDGRQVEIDWDQLPPPARNLLAADLAKPYVREDFDLATGLVLYMGWYENHTSRELIDSFRTAHGHDPRTEQFIMGQWDTWRLLFPGRHSMQGGGPPGRGAAPLLRQRLQQNAGGPAGGPRQQQQRQP